MHEAAHRYADDFDEGFAVDGAVWELFQCGVVSSTKTVTTASWQGAAAETFRDLPADDLRRLRRVVIGGKALRTQERVDTVAGLFSVMVGSADGV